MNADRQAQIIIEILEELDSKIAEPMSAAIRSGLLPHPEALSTLERQLLNEEFSRVNEFSVLEFHKAWIRAKDRLESIKLQASIAGLLTHPQHDTKEMIAQSQVDQNKNERQSPTRDGLTEREREVAHLLTQGKTNKEIARELMIEPTTVKEYKKRIRDDWGLNTTKKEVMQKEALRRNYGNAGL